MIRKRTLSLSLALAVCAALFAGCGNSAPSMQADLSYTQTNPEHIPLAADVRVVGLGEESHGVAEYHQMKAEVFRSLVKDSGCRTFIIEGDFGGALKVDAYVNGGEGTAREAVRAIGFAIYRTQEMVDLVEMDAAKAEIAAVLGEAAFDFARECANTLLAYCTVQLSESYNTARDQCMYEKVEWFLQHGDGSLLFINGHNGHIAKTPVASYPCLGELLAKNRKIRLMP